MEYTIYDFAGNAGVAMIIGTYLLLQLNKISSMQLLYSGLNALGSTLIMISLLIDFNLSAFAVEAFWLAISFVGIIRVLMRKAA